MSSEATSDLKPWQDNIAVHFIVQEEMQKHDKLPLWQYCYPELAATEEQIAEVERHLGYPLDQGYRNFLRCANGWKCFTQDIYLFGTFDLLGSDLMRTTLEMLDIMDDAFPLVDDTGFFKEELLPIAASTVAKDLHVITKPTAHEPGIVIWFAGQEIERYPNFEEYFLTMTDYNREEINALKRDACR
ncbi:MAG: SMI1/KNR4 family protein [Coriobacteriales bacterium]|jgi:hypothetical protein|nr:SMI1/KNR4 family protein [Coriobacteriales bacterium]